jgi:hypothetical protein
MLRAGRCEGGGCVAALVHHEGVTPHAPPHALRSHRAARPPRRLRVHALQVHARAAGASTTAPPQSRAATLDVDRLQSLLADVAALVAESGPRGPVRAVQALQAVASVAAEVATSSGGGQALPQPPVLLRRLFERLGATYIKLGQFIASSPTLFPEEYVLGTCCARCTRHSVFLVCPDSLLLCLSSPCPTIPS